MNLGTIVLIDFDYSVDWRVADVALQRRLGLLSKWRFGTGRADFGDFVVIGEIIARQSDK